MGVLERFGEETAFVVDDRDATIDGRQVRDLVMAAHGAGASILVLPAAALDPAFFDLRTGVAGDILQASVVYAMPIAIVGDLPEPAASSAAFAALVRESNAGRQHVFVASLEALAERLAAG